MNFLFRLSLISLLTPLLLPAQQVDIRMVPDSKTFTHTPYLRFDPVQVKDSLFQASALEEMLLHDSKGYVWFWVEEGKLSRFDGYYFKSFTSEKFASVSEAPNGQIFAPTNKGIALFDSLTDTFVHYPVDMKGAVYIGNITPVHQDKVYLSAGTPRSGTPSWLYEFDLNQRSFTLKMPDELINGFTGRVEARDSIHMARPYVIDHKGRLWGHVDHKDEAYLGYYDTERNHLVWYPLENAHSVEFSGKSRPHQILNLYWTYAEPDGRYVWAGGWVQAGLLRLDTQTLSWKQYYFNRPELNRVYKVLPLTPDKLLIQSEDGLSVFDKKNETLHLYPHIPDNPFSPQTGFAPYMNTGRQGIWMGDGADDTFRVLHPDRQYFRKIPEPLTLRQTFRIIGKSRNKIYYSFRDKGQVGLSEYNEVTRKERIIYTEPDDRKRIYLITQAFPDSSDGSVWFSGSLPGGSMFRWRETTNRFEPVKEKIDGVPFTTYDIADQRDLVRAPDGSIWFSTVSMKESLMDRTHLIRYDPRSGRYNGYLEGTHGLPVRNKSSVMICDRRGVLWIGYQSSGIITWFDTHTRKAEIKRLIEQHDPNQPSTVNGLVEDRKRDVVWISAFREGLWKYELQKDTWQQVISGPVNNLCLDSDGNLWYRTFSALVRYQPETGEKKEFGKEYGFMNFESGRLTQTSDGELFFQDFRFYPRDIPRHTTRQQVVFSFIRVFDKEIPESEGINYRKQITLRYDQNFFSIGFAILAPFAKEQNSYAYQLEGFNEDWVFTHGEPLAVFTNVTPGAYRLKVKGANADGVWSDERAIYIVITPPWWQTWWFRILAVLTLAFLLYTVYRYRLRQQTLQSRLEAETARYLQREAELSRQVAETEIAALRAQMNPHFIFNCLNSIQYYTARNEPDTASEYLSKFSRLIRLVLENSRSEKVTLEKELETLQLYIEMEVMRFQDKVNYRIDIAPEVDTDMIEIPPLLIQPFAENAVWHGLMHKEEGGTITVEVSKPAAGLLRITITDDGIGREKAAELKSKSATKRKSFGMKVTEDRIALINQLYHTKARVEVTDLKDISGRPVGTRVVVEIQV